MLGLLKAKKIDIQGLEVRPGKTFHWEGRYGYDPNQRTTVKTELNVFENFSPVLPDSYRKADIVFLANIDPELQGKVLAQVRKPRLVAMDTMNIWIQGKPDAVMNVLKKVNIFFANDEEIRMLVKETNLIRAGKKILKFGPSLVIVKKGEHGALVFGKGMIFGIMAHPCEEVVDPTGAGDSFAGGFLGYLDKMRSFSRRDIRRAAVFGSVLASYAIEDFGIGRFQSLTSRDIQSRYVHLKKLITF
jgi:sugar/nucleoside kinase (ribokinase family)